MTTPTDRPTPEEEALAFTVASVWREARVSCPHPDLLRAWSSGALEAGAQAFVDFHLKESQCPFCNAVLEELSEAEQAAAEPRMADMRARLLRSTVTALRARRP